MSGIFSGAITAIDKFPVNLQNGNKLRASLIDDIAEPS